MVASKFLNDEGEDDEVFNTEWAQSGDLTVSQMNQLEKDFLKAIVSELCMLLFIILKMHFHKCFINIQFYISLGLDCFRSQSRFLGKTTKNGKRYSL